MPGLAQRLSSMEDIHGFYTTEQRLSPTQIQPSLCFLEALRYNTYTTEQRLFTPLFSAEQRLLPTIHRACQALYNSFFAHLLEKELWHLHDRATALYTSFTRQSNGSSHLLYTAEQRLFTPPLHGRATALHTSFTRQSNGNNSSTFSLLPSIEIQYKAGLGFRLPCSRVTLPIKQSSGSILP
jgi:hypothetical protein